MSVAKPTATEPTQGAIGYDNTSLYSFIAPALMDWSALTSQHVWANIWIICRWQIEADRARLDWVVLESAHFETGAPKRESGAGARSIDGSRFLMIQDAAQDIGAHQLNVVLNWSEELRRLGEAQKN